MALRMSPVSRNLRAKVTLLGLENGASDETAFLDTTNAGQRRTHCFLLHAHRMRVLLGLHSSDFAPENLEGGPWRRRPTRRRWRRE